MRSDIEAKAGIDAVDIYGLSEVMGPGVASECVESKDGPVIWEDHFYPEIIDPETGELKADGEEGELVFTSLSKEAMERNFALDKNEVAAGFVLTCQAHPLTERVTLSFDER